MNENNFDPFNEDQSGRIDLSKESTPPPPPPPPVSDAYPPQYQQWQQEQQQWQAQQNQSQPYQSQPYAQPQPQQQSQPLYQDFGRGESLKQSGSVPPVYERDMQQYYQQQQGAYPPPPAYQQPPQGYGQPYPDQYQQYQTYGGQNPYAGYPQQGTGLATASLVIGILSILGAVLTACIPIPLLFLPVVGIVLGIVHKSKHIPEGRGKSTAGIITSAIGLILPILMWVIIIAMLPQMMEYVKETDPETYQQIYDQYGDQLPQFFSVLFSVFLK